VAEGLRQARQRGQERLPLAPLAHDPVGHAGVRPLPPHQRVRGELRQPLQRRAPALDGIARHARTQPEDVRQRPVGQQAGGVGQVLALPIAGVIGGQRRRLLRGAADLQDDRPGRRLLSIAGGPGDPEQAGGHLVEGGAERAHGPRLDLGRGTAEQALDDGGQRRAIEARRWRRRLTHQVILRPDRAHSTKAAA
jgi:hypothetical protein